MKTQARIAAFTRWTMAALLGAVLLAAVAGTSQAAVHVGGPTLVGHYFIPALATATETIAKMDPGPVLAPGKVFDWSLTYDPAAGGGNGQLRVTLGDQSVTLNLKPGQKAQGANLARFGMFTSTIGGQMVKIFLDDLTYTFGGTPRVAAQRENAKSLALAPIEDQPGLPRVLLIGDSISIGYTLPTREQLQGKANVHRIPTNGGPTSKGVASIDRWLGDGKWDVIHFDWGIHDLKIMPDGKRQVEPADYEKNLRALVAKLKATGARLIWATTTPIPDVKLVPPRSFGSVSEYNAIAKRVMTENGVAIDDLNAAVTPHLAELQKPNDVHFKAEGSEFLAKQVAASIRAALPLPK